MIRDARREPPWLTIALAGSMAVLYAALGPAPQGWVYDRAAIAGGEWWRLLSGHWLHADAGHLGWNLAALLLLGTLVERQDRGLLLACVLLGGLAVNITLLWALPGMTHYCGLSGVLNTLLLPVLAGLRRPAGNGPLWLMVGLSLGKILVELTGGAALFTDTSWASVPEAHLAGWLAGLLPGAWIWASGWRDMLPRGSDNATFSTALSPRSSAA